MAEMYELHESKRNTQNPSFSSSLLDEIYRSIDGGDEKFGEFKARKQKVAVKKTGGIGGGSRGRSKSKSTAEDEEIAGFRLVDKWMEMKAAKSGVEKLAVENDPLFFSSGSSSSDSSFGWYSEPEPVKPKPSCFGPLNKVKTSVSSSSTGRQPNGFYPFDDDQTDKSDNSDLVRSKTRSLKLYASLKKSKQPISPGGRLTTFINAIFTNKSKDLGNAQAPTRRNSKSTNVSSTCSSASSFSRSCLNKKTDHGSRRRTVTFLDRNGQKNIRDEPDFEKLPRTTFRWAKPNLNDFLMKKNYVGDYAKDEDEDDIASDASSDLFELDHLTMFKKDQYCEDLPVYETTHIGTNRAIASGLVC